MLTAIEGGRERGVTRSAAAALEAFVCESTRTLPAGRAGEAVVIAEVLASFLVETLEALGGESGDRPHGPAEADLDALPSGVLVRAAGSCLRLFPYQCVVSSSVLEILQPSMRTLVLWLEAQRDARAADRRAFERDVRAAGAALAHHLALQRAIEALDAPAIHGAGTERIVGHFVVTQVRDAAIEVVAPERDAGCRVMLPVRLPVRFRAGQVVSLALQRTAFGCLPLAATLPIRPAALDELLDRGLAWLDGPPSRRRPVPP